MESFAKYAHVTPAILHMPNLKGSHIMITYITLCQCILFYTGTYYQIAYFVYCFAYYDILHHDRGHGMCEFCILQYCHIAIMIMIILLFCHIAMLPCCHSFLLRVFIWNRDMHYKNRVFSTYRFGIGTGTYWYVVRTGTYLVQTGTGNVY